MQYICLFPIFVTISPSGIKGNCPKQIQFQLHDYVILAVIELLNEAYFTRDQIYMGMYLHGHVACIHMACIMYIHGMYHVLEHYYYYYFVDTCEQRKGSYYSLQL